jgi:hypothetical protein
MTIKTYSEMRSFKTFEERFEYLSLKGQVGTATFGFERWMNQAFYTSREWRHLRHSIILRDNGCDLGVDGFEIAERLIIHHINPMRPEDFEEGNPAILEPDNLITTTHTTHNAIHFGNKDLLRVPPPERRPGDTKLW